MGIIENKGGVCALKCPLHPPAEQFHKGRGGLQPPHDIRFLRETPQPWTPPPKTQVTIVGKNEIYHRENLVGSFLVHHFLGPRAPFAPPPLF